MPAENLGEPRTGVYSVSGGQAQLFERGHDGQQRSGRVIAVSSQLPTSNFQRAQFGSWELEIGR
jgi:hypothetical protein